MTSKPNDDLDLQNAVIADLTAPGIGSKNASELFVDLGVEARTPSYDLEGFIAFLELMRERNLIARRKPPAPDTEYSARGF
jgi:hypothetical protein